jgi:hypothetical protein
MKTVAAFQRQIDGLCEVTWRELPDPADVDLVREEIAAVRAMRGRLLQAPLRLARCASRFIRVLDAADDQLPAEEIAELEQYVQQCLGGERRAGRDGPAGLGW